MNITTNKPIIVKELLSAIKSCYPNSLAVIEPIIGGSIIDIDINEGVKYRIFIKKSNLFEVTPLKAFWNRTFEMNAKAQEIGFKIQEFIDNGNLLGNLVGEIPTNCPTCKNPNTKLIRLCEWCGSQIN
jgi:hypothetical protein